MWRRETELLTTQLYLKGLTGNECWAEKPVIICSLSLSTLMVAWSVSSILCSPRAIKHYFENSHRRLQK
ncbi:hypothetical protein IFVP5_C2180006 [Vibrio parahaemolyticus]